MTVLQEYIPKYIAQTIATVGKQVVTAERWNELWNLNIVQGDYLSEYMVEVIDTVLSEMEIQSQLLQDYGAHAIDQTDQKHYQIGTGLPEFQAPGSLWVQLGEILSPGGGI